MSIKRGSIMKYAVAGLLGFAAAVVPGGPVWAATWSVVPTPNATDLSNSFSGVDARTTTDVWAVGGARYETHPAARPLAARWNGTEWTLTPTPTLVDYGGFSDVDAVAANDAWAVGFQEINGVPNPLTERWNGSAWSVVPSPMPPGSSSGSLSAVKAFSATDVWAVGTHATSGGGRTLAQRWNGSSWSQVPTPSPNPRSNGLNSIDGVSTNDLWAVGTVGVVTAGETQNGIVLRWNGSAWSQVALPAPDPALSVIRLEDVVAVASNDVWIVGSAQQGCCDRVPYYLHWTGTGWQQGFLTGRPIFSAVTALSATQVYAFGGGTISRWTGTTWSVETSTIPGTLEGASATGTSTVWAVGYNNASTSRTLAVRTTNG